MKGRSHRLQSHDLHEDWVDGSWTVDCICGVNFDDGEEMVNCDECGVWVHTRCSRYVKGDELFTCDKCKNKSNKGDSEETEVAQLLVELPTKTIRLESSYAVNGPSRRSFRLWTDIPMEERVHVQGIPGGDPALFSGLSSVFTPELWNCTGYVPKRFNFQYREFPCWDEKECGDSRNEEDNGNTVDKGAGVLFSLAKESPTAAFVGVKGRGEEGIFDTKQYSKGRKNWVNEDSEVRHSQIGVKKERSLLRPVVIHSNKRKKEDLGTSKEQSGKKKARAACKEVDAKKDSHVSRTAFTSTSDAKPLEFYEDRGPKSIKSDGWSIKNKKLRDSMIQEHESDCYASVGNGAEKSKNSVAVIECSSEALSTGISRHNFPTEVGLNEGKVNHESLEAFKSSPKLDNVAASVHEQRDVGTIPAEQEGDKMPNGNLDDTIEGSAGSDVKPSTGDLATTVPAVDSQINWEHALSVSPSGDHKAQEVDGTPEAISDCHADKVNELTSEPYHIQQELEVFEGFFPLQKCPSEPKLGSTFGGGGIISNFVAVPSKNKIVVCVRKSTSTSSAFMVSKSSDCDNFRSVDTLDTNPNTKQQVISECNYNMKKDRAACDVVKVKDEDNQDVSRRTVNEHPKSSVNSASKPSNSSKISHTSVIKRTVSDSKDSALHSSSKTSSLQNSCETTGFPQNECASQAQNKASASGLPLRGEKFNHCSSQSSSKANHAICMNPPPSINSSATLSDEELALLLHQELNSSPRVPRVPRVRHAGSLPQLASPTATSLLIKRTSSSGGRDSSLVSRRKKKDASKDGFSRSHEPDDEAKKWGRVPSSPDQKRQDTGCTVDELSKREDNGSPIAVHSVKKGIPPASASTANSGPSSSSEFNDHHLSSLRNSPRNTSDEETGTVLGPAHHTLPGLINEIMSKGRRMTYEELCNAVLPHWHNLRKHNGERYAYSSHSQAVLDCLRNRHEWAQLVDRGPKTNSSRKRRKLDAEESEDNDCGKGRNAREGESKSLESQRDEFPKGKRKARKRRRLALQGRGIKEIRKRRKADLLTDEDSGPFSNSSDESLFSDDEIPGGGAGPVGTEASASSDETGAM
ncbi:hypothetical protein P3X46_016900 [Hevea brasiliensis]|uniref:Zinc finger PHD-type domain-containing protein n=1 Tax=Hevea brasiliensis TaxID=3981 RepID=A0ABQ9M0K3_HEVBR|nr:uncharacterized protein LOC110663361 isoform X2 [Hevea brasiliensis]KAJ9173797.1 hypothetical protein P3X46_016900 [Hevea brasiliensis]